MIEAETVLQNRYHVVKQIGQGGMGAVYVAKDERFGSTVAIKETLFGDENFHKAFEREARLLNSLRHPALPNVSDYFSEGNRQFLVMQFIPGDDLSEKLEKNGAAFPLEDVMNWARQLLEALDFLHTQEMPVIHRDIKPQNLKLMPNGQIILLDFGLAKGTPTDASHLTNANSIFGYSKNYASLEQMQGTGTDPRSDLYSLAATLYHLLTGVPPADSLTRAMSVLNEQPDPLKPANELHAQVPAGIANVLQRAMALNSNQRPASANEMLRMFDENENYADADEIETVFAKPVFTNLLNQETKLMPQDSARQENLKTSVMPVGLAENETAANSRQKSFYETNVFSGGENTAPPRSSRKFAYIFGAIASLLLVGGGAFALFFVESNDAPQNLPQSDPVQTISDSKNDVESVNSAEIADANSANSNSGETASTENPNQKISETKPETNGKTGETVKKNKPETKDQTVPEITVWDDEEGNVRIRGNTIETDRVIIDEKGMRLKNGKPLPPDPPKPEINLTPDQMERLTPKQRARLKAIMIENERRRKEAERRKFPNVVQPPNP